MLSSTPREDQDMPVGGCDESKELRGGRISQVLSLVAEWEKTSLVHTQDPSCVTHPACESYEVSSAPSSFSDHTEPVVLHYRGS